MIIMWVNRLRWSLVVALVGCLAATISLAQIVASTNVRLRVVDVFGLDLPYRVKSFINNNTGADLAGRFVDLAADGLPSGTYLYLLARRDLSGGAGQLSGSIDVRGGNDVLKVLLGERMDALMGNRPVAVSSQTPKDFSIEGSVSPSPGPAAWIRLKGVYQDYQIDLAIRPDGSFRISEPLEGLFTLIFFQREAVLGVRAVVFMQGGNAARLNIDLVRAVAQPIVVRP